MQPSLLLAFLVARAHCWLMFNLVATRTPKSFSVNLLPSWVSPNMYRCMGFFLPRCRTLFFSSLNFTGFMPAHLFSLSGSLKFTEGALYPIVQIDKEDAKQGWTQYLPLGYSAHHWPPTRLCTTYYHPLGPSIQAVFSPPHLCAHTAHTSTVCL